MPDLTGFPALDVLIGLALMFFVLSTVCSAVNEAIAALLAWRAKNLEQAIRNLLGGKGPGLRERFSGTRSGKAAAKYVEAQVKAAEEKANAIAGATEAQIKQAVDAARAKANAAVHDLTQEVFEHWRIRSLVRRPGASFLRRLPVVGWRGPSYIPPHAFALALEETLFPEGDSDDAFTHAKDKIDRITNERVRNALGALLVRAEKDRDAFRTGVETWFDDTMERASGWYKRKVQIMLFVIATAVAGVANANAINVAHRLWTDDALRSAVVQKADAVAGAQAGQSGPSGQSGTGTSGAAGRSLAVAQQPSTDDAAKPEECKKAQAQTGPTTPASPQSLSCALQGVAKAVDDVGELGLPLGWGKGNKPKESYGGIPGTIGGILITIFALSLGAPFWFDVLSKASSLRNTGKKIRTKADVDAAADTPVKPAEVVVRIAGNGESEAGGGGRPTAGPPPR